MPMLPSRVGRLLTPVCLIVVWLSLVLAAMTSASHARGGLRGCTLQPGPTHTVMRVVDAATLVLDNGATVRLANLIIPRAADLDVPQLPAEEAARAALAALATNTTVRLWFDVARADRHGTLRAHVTTAADGDERWLQAVLLEAGHARLDARLGERACAAPLLAAEAVARAAGSGVWAMSAFRVRSPTPASALAPYRGTFQIVEGEVVRVETARDHVRLVFGGARRRAVSVSVRTNDRDLLTPLGGDLGQLVGRRIEARGYVGTRPGGGIDLDVSLAGDVRLVP